MYKGKFTPVAIEERGKIHSVFTEKARKHSQKPDIAYEIIERLYPNAKNWKCMLSILEVDGIAGDWRH